MNPSWDQGWNIFPLQTRWLQEQVVNELVQEMVSMEMENLSTSWQAISPSKRNGTYDHANHFSIPGKIGILGKPGHINPAQEHIVSNIIRQNWSRLLKLPCLRWGRKNGYALLPEGEHQWNGHFICFVPKLKIRGIKNPIYLGANIPMKDVEYVCDIKKPDYIFIHLTSAASNFNFENSSPQFPKNWEQQGGYFRKLAQTCKNQPQPGGPQTNPRRGYIQQVSSI